MHGGWLDGGRWAGKEKRKEPISKEHKRRRLLGSSHAHTVGEAELVK